MSTLVAHPMSLMIIGGCHSLTNINGKIIGDPMERSAFEALSWQVNGQTGTSNSKSGDVVVKQVKKFLFDSTLK